MRLWSLHPRYLDQKGLCGLWRETIMAQNALEAYANQEKHQYKNHPQLERFKSANPGQTQYYIYKIWEEAQSRGYNFNDEYFDNELVELETLKNSLPVTNGQVEFETWHLWQKLTDRESFDRANRLISISEDGEGNIKTIPDLHPLFFTINGDKADWERG